MRGAGARVLVAGIGNLFLGDDGFGVEVVRRLAQRALPDDVAVCDFGIRGMDLAYELLERYEAVIFVDALPRGGEPGTLYLIEPQVEEGEASIDTHGMDPVSVLRLARALGAPETRTLIVGCEPAVVRTADDEDILVELSPAVEAAVDEAVIMVEDLIEELACRTAERR